MWHECERRENCKRFWWETPKKKDHSEDKGVVGRMGSECLGRLAGGCILDSTGSGQGPVASCCECGDEPSGSCATDVVSLALYLKLLIQQFVTPICLFLHISGCDPILPPF
jgi:hypothetical protein